MAQRMKQKKYLVWVSVVVITIIIFYSFQGGESMASYIEKIEKEREETGNFMRNDQDSPFQNGLEFKGLSYYPPDPKYKIKAHFTPSKKKSVVTLATSDQKESKYLIYGHATFQLNGKENKLLILEVANQPFKGTLFLAFGDATSAIETYGAGRYLDVEHKNGRTIELDFNLAYNPYCAYSNEFSCPLPPQENLLGIPIEAGEKDYAF